MSIAKILARCDCDFCGQKFEVELDPARKMAVDESLFDVIDEVIRDQGARGPDKWVNMHLCGGCSIVVLRATTDDQEITEALVRHILEKHHGR